MTSGVRWQVFGFEYPLSGPGFTILALGLRPTAKAHTWDLRPGT
jgi:hypothetical protein